MCAILSETLLLEVTPIINDALTYQLIVGGLDRSDVVGLANPIGGNNCQAYVLGSRSTVFLPCSSSQPTLCTSTVNPTLAEDRDDRPASPAFVETKAAGLILTGYRDADTVSAQFDKASLADMGTVPVPR